MRYKRSVLGLAWTVLNPLLMMAITTIVFSNFFGFAIDHFPIYMLSAQILFAFFAQGSVAGSTSIVSSASLTRRVYVPPALMPIASVNSAAVNLLLSLIPLFLLMAVTGGRFSWALLFLPVAMALAFLFTFGVALLLATATVFFHDTVPMYQVLLTALTYLTPIFWPLEIVPKEWMPIIQLNPLYHLVQLFRQPIYGGVLPDASHLCAALAYSVGVAVLGWWYCQRSRNAFATYV